MKPFQSGNTEYTEEAVLDLLTTTTGAVLVLHNDDFNTFDHVITCLVKICGHDELQAEQCALIVHLRGKAEVKTGTWEQLAPMKQALIDSGLSVTIEEK